MSLQSMFAGLVDERLVGAACTGHAPMFDGYIEGEFADQQTNRHHRALSSVPTAQYVVSALRWCYRNAKTATSEYGPEQNMRSTTRQLKGNYRD